MQHNRHSKPWFSLVWKCCACLSQKQKYNQFVKMTNGKGVQHGLYSLPERCDPPVEIDR